MPTARGYLTAQTVNGQVWALGGYSYDASSLRSTYYSTVEVFDPATATWSTAPSMPYKCDGLASATIGGTVYVMGGRDSQNSQLGNVAAFDTSAGSWVTLPDLLTPRTRLTAQAVDGIIYTFGGYYGEGNSETFHYVNSAAVEAFNPSTGTWKPLTPMTTARNDLSSAVVDGIIYVIGGSCGSQGTGQLCNLVQAYDPATDSWTDVTPMNEPRAGQGSVAIKGAIWTFDGDDNQGTVAYYKPESSAGCY